MEEKTPETFKDLNEELLKPSVDESDEPRRNSKEWLIQRVLLLCEENQLELTMSNSKLKRLGKTQLQKLLAELTEESIKNQMAAAVQAPSTDERVMAVATLRMLHDTLANGCELGLNRWLPQHGYELDGFTKGFKEPKTSQIVDDCLREIAEESDILQYIESPYTEEPQLVQTRQRKCMLYTNPLLTSKAKVFPIHQKKSMTCWKHFRCRGLAAKMYALQKAYIFADEARSRKCFHCIFLENVYWKHFRDWGSTAKMFPLRCTGNIFAIEAC